MVQIHITRASNSILNNTEHWLTYIQLVRDQTDVMLNVENEPIHAFFGTSRPCTNLLWPQMFEEKLLSDEKSKVR